jgi:hypothetical protein
METVEKRRRYPRIPSQNSVLVKRLGDDSLEGFTRTRMVGLGGCMFVSDQSMGVGSFLDLLISVKGSVAKALSKVVYERQFSGNEFEVGVEFVLISDVDRRLLEVLWSSANNGKSHDPVIHSR